MALSSCFQPFHCSCGFSRIAENQRARHGFLRTLLFSLRWLWKPRGNQPRSVGICSCAGQSQLRTQRLGVLERSIWEKPQEMTQGLPKKRNVSSAGGVNDPPGEYHYGAGNVSGILTFPWSLLRSPSFSRICFWLWKSSFHFCPFALTSLHHGPVLALLAPATFREPGGSRGSWPTCR